MCIPDCHNPTTHVMSVDCREMLARVARELDLLIIEESMARLILAKTYRTVFSMAPERTIYILSFSKVVNPALRLAYMAVPEICRMEIDNALYNLNLSQSALLLEIASRLIVSGKLEDVIESRRKGLEIRNQITNCILDGYEVRGSKYSLGRWLMLPEGISGLEFEQMALEKVDSVALGCTELPLIFDGMDSPVPVLDTMRIHVDDLIKMIME